MADALDAGSVLDAVRHIKPDVIIDELTSLPKHYTPEEMKAAAPRDKEVRVKGNANLFRCISSLRYCLASGGDPHGGLHPEEIPTICQADARFS